MITIDLAGKPYNQGETAELQLKSAASSDLPLNYTLKFIDYKGHTYFENPGSLILTPLSQDVIPFIIPTGLVKGYYDVIFSCQDDCNNTGGLVKSIYIADGYDNNLQISLPKWNYQSSEQVNIDAALTNSQNLNQYNLEVKVYPYEQDIQTYTTANGLSDNGVIQVIADYQDVWVETGYDSNRDINRYNLTENKFTIYPGKLGGGTGKGAAIDKEYIWWGTGAGAARFNKIVGEYDCIPYLEGLAFSIDRNDRKYVWIGGWNRIIKYDQTTGESQYFDNIALDYILSMANDEKSVWFGTYSGLHKFDKQTQTWTQYNTSNSLPNNTINDIEIENSDIWIATNNGLVKYEQTNNQWNVYNKEDGLKSNQVQAIVLDGAYLWAVGEGLSRYNRKTNQWAIYGTTEGIMTSPTTAATDIESIWLGAYGTGLQRINTTGDIIKTIAINPSDSNFNVNLGNFNGGEYVIVATLRTNNGDIISQAKENFIIDDNQPPVTEIQVSGLQLVDSGKTYITEKTNIYFVATDTGTSPSGIDFTEYVVDASTWTVYASSFTLAGEGDHAILYRSKDKAGNLEDTKQAVYYLDNTAPACTIKTPDTSYQTPGGSTYFVSPASFTVTAVDTLVGVDYVEYVVDNSTPVQEAYQNPIEIISNFADGSHFIKYFSVDKLGNKEAENTLTFFIDGNGPETKLQIADGSWQIAGKTYINANSKIELTAADTGAGIDHINYRVDAGTTTVYTEPFNLNQEGLHTLYYSATDKLGTMEAEKSYVLYADTTTPDTQLQIVDNSYEIVEGTTTYINSHSTFTISAIDPLSNSISSGIKNMQYKIDAGSFTIIPSTTNYQLSTNIPDGQHTIAYQSIDNVENTETEKVYAAMFDGTKPLVKSTYPANNAKVKAKLATPITITFSEPVKSADWTKSIEIRESGKVVEWYSNKDFNITYDTTTYTVSIDGKLKNNKVYEVILKDTISDRVRNYLDACWFSFRTTMNAAEGGTFSDPATGLTLIIPPNALPVDGYFELAILDQINPPKLPKPLTWLFAGQKAYQIIFYDENEIIVQEPVKKAFQVLLSMNQQWIALAMETNPIEYKNIKVYQTGSVTDFVASIAHQGVASNSEKTQFSPRLMTEQSYNDQAQELVVEMDSFGMFALAGFTAPDISLDDLSCYPNPFNPCKQDITIQYYLLNDSEVTIAIYDLLGNLVKTWEIPSGDMNARTGLNQLTWDGRNGQGDIVANGGYILFVHSDGQKKKFKILVVK